MTPPAGRGWTLMSMSVASLSISPDWTFSEPVVSSETTAPRLISLFSTEIWASRSLMSLAAPAARASATVVMRPSSALIRAVWSRKLSTAATDWERKMPEVGLWARDWKVVQTLSREAK